MALLIPGSNIWEPFGPGELPGLAQPRFRQLETLIRVLLQKGPHPQVESVLLCRVSHLVSVVSPIKSGWRLTATIGALHPYKLIRNFSGIGSKAFWELGQPLLDEEVRSRGKLSRL